MARSSIRIVSLAGAFVSRLGPVRNLLPGADGERGGFLPGRLRADMLVPSSGTFTQDRKLHGA